MIAIHTAHIITKHQTRAHNCYSEPTTRLHLLACEAGVLPLPPTLSA
jgi:hypothetical protein